MTVNVFKRKKKNPTHAEMNDTLKFFRWDLQPSLDKLKKKKKMWV